MSRSVSADEARALMLANTLRRVPERLKRVQTALKPVAQGESSSMSVDDRLTVAQACSELQFAIADVASIFAFVSGPLESTSIAEKTITTLGHAYEIVPAKTGGDLH